MAGDAAVALVAPLQADVMEPQAVEAISLAELSSIRFATLFDPATKRIVLHDLTPSTGRPAQGARRAIVVD